MAQDRTRYIVRKTIEQMTMESATGSEAIKTLNAFEARLDFNLNLAGVPKVTGRKPKAKTPKAD